MRALINGVCSYLRYLFGVESFAPLEGGASSIEALISGKAKRFLYGGEWIRIRLGDGGKFFLKGEGKLASQQIVTASWLAEHLQDEDVVLADCRFDLLDPEAGRKQYRQDHIPGAVYFDLEEDLSAAKREHGGRHPLPDVRELAVKLGKAGIDEATHVVAYDDQNGSMAARLWWLLRYLGHEKTSVLGVRYSTWKAQGYPLAIEIPDPAEREFTPHIQEGMALNIEDVKREKRDENTVLVDARAPERYRGEHEAMDPKAGHIPGAENWFWADNVRADENWKAPEELESRFQSLQDRDVIVYCGSGVSAAADALAMKEAGLDDVKLYVGSWSDWSSYPENPVETGEPKK